MDGPHDDGSWTTSHRSCQAHDKRRRKDAPIDIGGQVISLAIRSGGHMRAAGLSGGSASHCGTSQAMDLEELKPGDDQQSWY